jgi:hypothetical protein
MMTERHVKRLDIPVAAAIKCFMQLGVGANDLLSPVRAKGWNMTRAGCWLLGKVARNTLL